VLDDEVSATFKEICLQIEERYEIHFLEIGLDEGHVHFLIQSVPMNAPKKIIGAVKSITAKVIFWLHPEVKRMLWGGRFWTSGYYVNTRGSQNIPSCTGINSNYFDTPMALPQGSSFF
jgi:REP element-mobilizing transposase RayT